MESMSLASPDGVHHSSLNPTSTHYDQDTTVSAQGSAEQLYVCPILSNVCESETANHSVQEKDILSTSLAKNEQLYDFSKQFWVYTV